MTDQPTNFRDLVRHMRSAQIEFYANRSQARLLVAKKLEKRVDTWLAKHAGELAEQVELFGDDDASHDRA
jgi:hypothetical protein